MFVSANVELNRIGKKIRKGSRLELLQAQAILNRAGILPSGSINVTEADISRYENREINRFMNELKEEIKTYDDLKDQFLS